MNADESDAAAACGFDEPWPRPWNCSCCSEARTAGRSDQPLVHGLDERYLLVFDRIERLAAHVAPAQRQ